MVARVIHIGVALSFVLLATSLGQAQSKIKLKNGDTVEGEIKGRIAAHVKSLNAFSILFGKDIDRIDEKGVYTREGANNIGGFTATSGNPPSAIDVLAAIIKTPAPTGFAAVDLKDGTRVFVLASTAGAKKTTDAIRGVVLGEVRSDDKMEKWELVPALVIVTNKGMVTIPVDKIIALEPEPQKTQEKKN